MKTACFLVMILMFWPGITAAQDQDRVDIFGYFETQYLGAVLKGDLIQLHSNKLRFDLKSDFSDHIRFVANFNALTYHGKTEWRILDFFPPGIAALVPEEQQEFYRMSFQNRYYLDNANVRLSYGIIDLTAGKQQISPGSGYAWNPTDVFNTKDLLDPTYEQPGHNALRLDLSWGGSHRLTVLYTPEARWKESAKILEWKSRVSRFDYTLMIGEKLWPYFDYTRFDPLRMEFAAVPEKRRLFGGSLAGELLGLGVWAEGAFNWMKKSGNFYELVLGLDYTFDSQTYILAEYFRNTMADSHHRDYDLNDWMRWLSAENRTIVRDQAYVFIQHPVTDLIRLGLSGIVGISDSSMALVPTLNASLADNVELYAYLNVYLGREGTAFSSDLGSGGIVRLRVYF